MTESPVPSREADEGRAERIARLQAGRRRSPATSTKVLVVGASSTAVLGMIAGFGVVDRLGATDAPASASVGVSVPDPIGSVSSIGVHPARSTRPEVIVVVVDETGKVIASSGGLDPAQLRDVALSGATPGNSGPESPASVVGSSPPTATLAVVTQTSPATATPPAAPVRVDVPVAVPAPISAAPAAAPAPPQATTNGS